MPTRDQIDPKYKWKLEDIYPSMEAWQQEAEEAQQLCRELAGYQGRLGESAETLLAALRLQDAVEERVARLVGYARMHRDEDNTNATYQALTDRSISIAVQVASAKAFVVPELLQIPQDTLWGYVEANAELKVYEFVLRDLFRQQEHVLSAEEEQLLAAAGEVLEAPGQIFTMFNDADMRFPTVRNDEGVEVELTHGRYIELMESRDRAVRKAAFDAMYTTYEKHRNTLAATYGASVKKDVFYASVRDYPSARAAALDDDNIPMAVYDNLLAAVHDSLPALDKYLKLRRQVLGVDELHMYDIYTPLVPELHVKIPYEEAVQTVIEAVAPLGEEYQRIAREGLASGWVDVYETKGKTSGAYSWGVYPVHPYILLNYQDSLDNVFTLAHELGHAMHTYFSTRTQPFVYAGYTLFVAEVASTCNEALLTDYLLRHTDDPQMRAYVLNHHLETIRGTLYRQTMFAEFEKLTHEHAERGEALTPDWLSETYFKLNETYYGGACVIDPLIAMEWARIPHFYRAFYVYKYATGISAATALSQKILRGGPQDVANYLGFLSGGGSNYSIELLRGAGVDMASPEPVKDTLRQFSDMVDELADILGKR
ncbi:MAG: oligoendopeptidase F [Alicyclobacillus sp.]|nr:oligoendopeptidase F [Alicyclobacillus sp.]